MCDHAVMGRKVEWLSVTRWESSTKGVWYDYPRVLHELRRELDRAGMKNVLALYVCGSDHARYCWGGFDGYRGSRKGLVIVPREKDEASKYTDLDNLVFGLKNESKGTDVRTFSSTLARKMFKMRPLPRDKLKEILHDDVLEYIQANALYGVPKNRTDRGDNLRRSKLSENVTKILKRAFKKKRTSNASTKMSSSEMMMGHIVGKPTIPAGHTAFSWSEIYENATPPGHSAFSWNGGSSDVPK